MYTSTSLSLVLKGFSMYRPGSKKQTGPITTILAAHAYILNNALGHYNVNIPGLIIMCYQHYQTTSKEH